jgi:hypothetical protein
MSGSSFVRGSAGLVWGATIALEFSLSTAWSAGDGAGRKLTHLGGEN